MLVNSSEAENFFAEELILKVESRMLDYTVLNTPKEIVTAGQQLLLGTATDLLPGVIICNTGTKHDVGFPMLIVPGLGRNLFFSFDVATRVIKTIVEAGDSNLESNGILVPLVQHK